MTKTEAKKHLASMMFAVQKARSIVAEGGVDESVLEMVNPWLYGKKGILPVVIKMNDKDFTPMDFYNMMVIATRFERSISALAGMQDPSFPTEPDIQWLKGWDPDVERLD